MLIEVTRTGGLPNLRRHVRVDTEKLLPDQRDRLGSLMATLDLDDLEDRSPLRGGEPGRFEYDITIAGGNRDRRVVVEDSLASDELLELLDLLFDGERR